MNIKSKFFLLVLGSLLFCNLFKIPVLAFYPGEKPLFVEISTDWCFACKMLKPIVEELKNEYGDKVEFVQLDPQAGQKATEYGVSDFFNKNKGVFPTVGVISFSGKVDKVIVGANKKEAYEEILNNLLGISKPEIDKTADDKGTSTDPDDEDITVKIEEASNGRPKEPQVLPGRPQEGESIGRPNETIVQGRPPELKFWSYNQPIPPCYANRFIVLPVCSGGNNILCANNTGTVATTSVKSEDSTPIYKPWTPFATRDEKGLHLKK